MAKFWLYFKKVVLVWGFVWLAIIIFIALVLALQNVGKSTEPVRQERTEVSFKKSEGDIDLKVTKIEKDRERWLVNIHRKKKLLVADYELPTEQFDLGWIEVDEAHIFPLGDKAYRIILFSTNQESDHEVQLSHIWIFKVDEKINLEKMIEISGSSRIPGDESRYFGNRVVRLASFDEERYQKIEVPVEIQVGQTLSVRPMLTGHSLVLLRQHYEKVIQSRIELLKKKKDEALLVKYKNAAHEFEDCLVEAGIPSK